MEGKSDAVESQVSWQQQKLEEERSNSPLETSRGNTALPTPYFRLLASRTVSEHISVLLNHQVCDNLLLHPRKSNVVRHLVFTWASWQGRNCLKGE